MTKLLINERLPSHYHLFQVVVKADDSSFRAAGLCTKQCGWFIGLPVFLSPKFRGQSFRGPVALRSCISSPPLQKNFSNSQSFHENRFFNNDQEQGGFWVGMKLGSQMEESVSYLASLSRHTSLPRTQAKEERKESFVGIPKRYSFSLVLWVNVAYFMKGIFSPQGFGKLTGKFIMLAGSHCLSFVTFGSVWLH